MDKKCCATCKYHGYVVLDPNSSPERILDFTWACFNGDSPYAGNFTGNDFVCSAHVKRDTDELRETEEEP